MDLVGIWDLMLVSVLPDHDCGGGVWVKWLCEMRDIKLCGRFFVYSPSQLRDVDEDRMVEVKSTNAKLSGLK